MDMYELAKLKMDRTILMCEKFDEMDEEEFKRFTSLLESTIQIMPVQSRNIKEKEEIQSYLGFINNMEFKKYGFIFKGFSRKSSLVLTKNDMSNLIWRAHSLLF